MAKYISKTCYFYINPYFYDLAMTLAGILPYHLINQQIAFTTFRKPKEIVSNLIAMQAQE